MARLLRLVTLYLSFTVEITVHAEALVRLPADCGLGDGGCSVSAAEKTAVPWQASEVGVARSSIVYWETAERMALVRGTVIVDLNEHRFLSLPSAEVTGLGQALVVRDGKRTRVTALKGEIKLSDRGRRSQILLPIGFMVDVGPITSKTGDPFEVPQTAMTAQTLRHWWSAFPGARDEFNREAKSWLERRTERAQALGDWQKTLVERQIAALRAHEAEALRKRQAEEKARADMRAMFRKLNYLGAELPD